MTPLLAGNRLKYILVFLFIGGLIGLFIHFNLTRPRVLILHSYDTGYSWTRDVNVGLRRILDHHTHYAIRWHYMDTKRHPDAHFKRIAGLGAQRAIEQWQPHVVIAVDDDAQEQAAKHFVNHPRINIVFAGVNGHSEPYGYPGAANVTGILERKQLLAVREVTQVIAASRKLAGPIRILHIGDGSGSVKEDAQFMDHFDWAPIQFVGSRLAQTFPEWQRAVQEAPQVADLILLTNYRKLARSEQDKTLVSNREAMRWTVENARIPLLGTNLFNVEDGANLAVGVSPYEQGEVAAQMAVEIIEHQRPPSQMPVRSTQQFIISMRKRGLLETGIRLPSVYEAFARATDNFYDIPGDGNDILITRPDTPSLGIGTAQASPVPPAPTSSVPAEPPALPASSLSQLELSFAGDSWVEVQDRHGKRMLIGARKSGDNLRLEGASPLRVKLGRPEAVRITYNGRPIDPATFGRQSFTLE